ncbi:hypothetical protein Trydic_g14845 [Trypoxylus dichotomus]
MRFLIVLFVYSFVSLSLGQERECGPNMVFSKCAPPCPARCDPSVPVPCPLSLCIAACKCIDGYVLKGDICVPQSEC